MKDRITILLVDDDQDDRKLFTEAVEEIDDAINCISFDSGQQVLLYLRNEINKLPDFIILDLRMPGLSGQKCLEEIKNDPRLEHLPVIIYTTSKEVQESIELKKQGAAHFVSKPKSAEEVYYLASSLINEKWN